MQQKMVVATMLTNVAVVTALATSMHLTYRPHAFMCGSLSSSAAAPGVMPLHSPCRAQLRYRALEMESTLGRQVQQRYTPRRWVEIESAPR